MPDLFTDLFVDIYYNWQQNERIASVVSHSAVVLLRKGPIMGEQLDHLRLKTELNAGYEILADQEVGACCC